MGAIVINLKNKKWVFTNWFISFNGKWTRVCGTDNFITIAFDNNYYSPHFTSYNSDQHIIEWGLSYYKIYEKPIKDLQITKDRIDKFLTETIPRFNKLLVFS